MGYRVLTGDEVKKVIEDHEAWLKDVYGDKGEHTSEFYAKKDNFDFGKLPKELADDPRRADFSNVKFTDESVKGDSYRTQFSCVDLSGADFKGADFSEVTRDIFNYTHLNYTDFSDAKIPFVKREDDRWNHNVFGCEFRHANLKGVNADLIEDMMDNCDLGSAVTDKGIINSVLVPYQSSQSLPNDYWQVNFYGVQGYANYSHKEYTNIPFDPLVVLDADKEALRGQGYRFDEKQHFLKFNEGQKVYLSAGRDGKEVDASELAKACCEAYLGKEKVRPKTVTNDRNAWFVKFNPTSRAPRHAIEFVPLPCRLDHDRLVMSRQEFADGTRAMMGGADISPQTDMIDRCEHFVLTDRRELGGSEPGRGDTYPTYVFGEKDLVARGTVVVCPFVMSLSRDKGNFEMGYPYNLRTMDELVENLMDAQNKKRIEFYKGLTVANGIVPPGMDDKGLTELAENNMVLIGKPWQLVALEGKFEGASRENVDKLASHIDCMDDKATIALQADVKKLGFLYYNTTDIAKQMEYIANGLRKNGEIALDQPVPSIGDGDVNKVMALYNEVVVGRKLSVESEGKELKEKGAEAKAVEAKTAEAKEADGKGYNAFRLLSPKQRVLATAIREWAKENDIRNDKGYLLSFNGKSKNPQASLNSLVKQAKAKGFVMRQQGKDNGKDGR